MEALRRRQRETRRIYPGDTHFLFVTFLKDIPGRALRPLPTREDLGFEKTHFALNIGEHGTYFLDELSLCHAAHDDVATVRRKPGGENSTGRATSLSGEPLESFEYISYPLGEMRPRGLSGGELDWTMKRNTYLLLFPNPTLQLQNY